MLGIQAGGCCGGAVTSVLGLGIPAESVLGKPPKCLSTASFKVVRGVE